MSTHAYKITDPDFVGAFVEAEQDLARWHIEAAAFLRELGPAVSGYTGRDFTGERTRLALRLNGSPEDLPDGWRYVKTRGTVEPKLHRAGEDARAAFAPFAAPPRQPRHVLDEHHVPTFLFDSDHTTAYSAGAFEHDGTVYLSYGMPVPEKELSPLMIPIRESELVLAREARQGDAA